MKRRIGLWIILGLFAIEAGSGFAQGLLQAKPEEVGMAPERLALLDTLMNEALTRKDFPGAVLLVARKGGPSGGRPTGRVNGSPKSGPWT